MVWSVEAVEKRLAELREKSEQFAKEFATRTYLDQYSKSLLAILMQRAESQGFASSASQEREARASEAYLKHLDALRIAVEASEKLRWELEVAKLGVGVWQTSESTRRMEMQVYGRS